MYKYQINYLIILLFFTSFLASAQEEQEKEKKRPDKQHAISYYIGIGPRMEYFAIDQQQASIVNPSESGTGHFFNLGTNFYHELRYMQKFGVRLGIHRSTTFLNDYIVNRYSSPYINVVDKNLNEEIFNRSSNISLYYIQPFKNKWSIHYELSAIYHNSSLRDNLIVHYYKENDLIAPLVEYELYEITRRFIGAGVNFVYDSDKKFALSLGVQLNGLSSQSVSKEINYYDDYYLLKDLNGIDVFEIEDPEDMQTLHITLLASIKFKVFGLKRVN